MEKEVLEKLLAEGLSHAAMGRRLGCHPATVTYWLDKHGLPRQDSANRARGAIPRDVLEALVEEDLTVRELAEALDRSVGTVRHWLLRYGLRTTRAARTKRHARQHRLSASCPRHGGSEIVVSVTGEHRCGRCRAEAVTAWRRRAKQRLVEEAGGACAICNYSRCLAVGAG